MKKTFYTFLIFSFISLNINSQTQYSSIDDVKRLNYELLEEIGFDDSQINHKTEECSFFYFFPNPNIEKCRANCIHCFGCSKLG